MKDILILGQNGMLGQMVKKYFAQKGFNVYTNPFRFNEEHREDFLKVCTDHENAIVFNCIGKIKQKTSDENELLWANSLLPLALRNHLTKSQILIHPSTDCVFDGKKGLPYSIADTPNASDAYGWSKRLGEMALEGRPRTLIPRVSIIGPDSSPEPKGLLGWFLSQKSGSKLKGFENHFWNGITTLEWCEQINQLLEDDSDFLNNGTTFQIGTKESYTKLELLQLFQSIFSSNYQIKSFSTESNVDRRLSPNIIAKSLNLQLKDLIENFN